VLSAAETATEASIKTKHNETVQENEGDNICVAFDRSRNIFHYMGLQFLPVMILAEV
jgi:hypothetical protein